MAGRGPRRILTDRLHPPAGQAMGGCQEVREVALVGVLRHGAPDRHHERDRRVDLLLRPLLGGVEVAAPVGLADHVADEAGAPLSSAGAGSGSS